MSQKDDLISRQAAMDFVGSMEMCDEITAEAYQELMNYLEELPSAQPELTDGQAIEHLQESGWMQNHDKQMYEMGLREQLADDSDSYDALLPSAQPEQFVKGCRNCKYGKYNDFWKTHFCYNPNECTKWNLWEPNAQPERPKGKWILVKEYVKIAAYKCSECGRNVWDDTGYSVMKDYPFCHCGAEMIGVEDGQ